MCWSPLSLSTMSWLHCRQRRGLANRALPWSHRIKFSVGPLSNSNSWRRFILSFNDIAYRDLTKNRESGGGQRLWCTCLDRLCLFSFKKMILWILIIWNVIYLLLYWLSVMREWLLKDRYISWNIKILFTVLPGRFCISTIDVYFTFDASSRGASLNSSVKFSSGRLCCSSSSNWSASYISKSKYNSFDFL